MKTKNDRQLNERDIKALLTPRERPVPPADLAARIKRQIPADLTMAPDLGSAAADHRASRSRVWLIAASVVLAVGGGFFAVRVMNQMVDPSEPLTATAAVDATVAEQEERGSPEILDVAVPDIDERDTGVFRSAPASGETSAEGTETPAGTMPTPVAPAPSEDLAASRGLSINEHLGEEAGADLDSALAQRLRARRTAPLLGKTTARESRPEKHKKEASSELGRRLDAQPSAARQVAKPAPTPLATELSGDKTADGEARVEVDTSSGTDMFSGGLTAEAAARRDAPAPPAAPRSAPAPAPRHKRAPLAEEESRARHYADAPSNAQIEYEYPQISDMRKEAQELEAELKALEESSPPPATSPSTGGTAEPNDAAYGDVFFAGAGTNPFIATEDDALSTFGLDVDTGSYTVIRRYLRDGHLPPPAAVRVEELVNYFDYGDTAPERQEFAIHAEGAPSIYGHGKGYHLLRFNLSGRELARADRRPALLTFVVDVSGSMRRENRLGLVKQALALLIDQLRADDRLALVIYGSRGQVVLQPTGDHGAIRRAIDQLHTGGSTNAEEGLELAYELAARHRRRGAINRVILCSDGVANVGATSAGSILDRIRREADQGIELTTVGFGMGNYNDVLMERLADTGNGRYAYVDTLDEARRIFVENLTGTLQTLAAEARVQVEFNPAVVSRYRLLGYENRDIADHRFRDDTVDAGEIGVGHKVTALYEIKPQGKLRDGDRIATLRLRYGSIENRKMVELERTVTGADFARRWEAASPALKLTSLVAEYAEILKRSYWAREGDLDDVFRRAQRLSADFEGDREVADFVSLVGRAAEYRERQRR